MMIVGLSEPARPNLMPSASLRTRLRPIKEKAGPRYRRWSVDRRLPAMPTEAVVPLDATSEVLLLCSRLMPGFVPQAHIQERAFAHELAARNRPFAITEDPSNLFEKSVAWFLPGRLVSPVLWNYSRQAYEFAAGLEQQGNRLFCSSSETAYWENKAHMHRKLAELGVPTPRTTVLTRENWRSVDFDIEPALIKHEHSAGSAGIRYFAAAADAREFVAAYGFRPAESLLMQEVVRGATKDMRLTMVGNTIIESATYWRAKSPTALSSSEWTTTATTYGSVVEHDHIPRSVGPLGAEYLRKLGLRTAGIDLIWVDDDVDRDPLLLELSPYYQPNPPKPARYDGWAYKKYKENPYREEGYFSQQYAVFRTIAGEILDQGLY
jgi:glutathione synthase/RimK-type ligase-like ATP-grasp enzyme